MPQFTNQASLLFNGQTYNSNIVTGEILDTLSLTKRAVNNQYSGNDNISYIISLVNTGNTPLTNLTLQDNLGGYAFGATTVYPLNYVDGTIKFYVDGVLQTTAPTVTAGPPMAITGITIPAGSNAVIAYDTRTTQFAPLANGTSINNTVTATGAGLTEPILASETAVPLAEPNLRITKSITPNTVTQNSPITYTFLIENYGNTAVADTENAVVNDTFNPILTNVSATLNGADLPITTGYTYDATTGQFATVPGQIAVPAATYTTNPTTGEITVNPGRATLTVTGTV
ncbi:MAG: hypothetical protein MJ090_00775 [Clostridia bacterium]|nr:hypothetical protein [Clostridia bacterium]